MISVHVFSHVTKISHAISHRAKCPSLALSLSLSLSPNRYNDAVKAKRYPPNAFTAAEGEDKTPETDADEVVEVDEEE